MEFSVQVALHEMHKKIESCENVGISPLGISFILDMIAHGATGETLAQLLHFLNAENVDDLVSNASKLMQIAKSSSNVDHGGDDDDDDCPVICNFNAVLVSHKHTLKKYHQEVLENMYHAKVQYVDFSRMEKGVHEVNEWVDRETKGLIKPLLLSNAFNNKYLTLIHANGLYFKASWQNEFHPLQTQIEEFHLLGEKADEPLFVDVPFMMKYESYYKHTSFDDYSVLEMPYNSGHEDKTLRRSFSMAIILPKEKRGLPKLVDKIREKPYLLSCKNMEYELISTLQVPKFTLSYCFIPSGVMQELGLRFPFEKDELSGMVEGTSLRVSNIIQHSRMECNEEGTEVLSCTYNQIDDECCFEDSPPRSLPINFIVDHPFVFVIKEDVSDTILFLGAIYNPLQ
ncbi:unnamed protein product [Cuscuta epithymum]|uniref:Serpin domain-containing protein n=1 Tax=Cuscuta epithymum TaxID=186058 RepID=A0AAV0EYU4_9ASTE|nr:unnamed protein product [Cuscuta epithymum]